MPDFPVDPSDLVRGLELLRSALVAPGQVGDSLPRAVDRAAEVTAAINRFTDELAKLNAHIERAMPVIESLEQQVERAMPVIESLQSDKGFLALRRGVRRAAREADSEPAVVEQPAQPKKPRPTRRTTATKRPATRPNTADRRSSDN